MDGQGTLSKIVSILILAMFALSLIALPVECAFAKDGDTETDANGHKIVKSEEDIAKEENPHYVAINTINMFNPDDPESGSGNGLWNGVTNIMKTIVTFILLPIGIIFVTWRSLYIATFVYIGHVDPLNMVVKDGKITGRYIANTSGDAAVKRDGMYNWGSLENFMNAPDGKNINQTRQMETLWRRGKRAEDWASIWNSYAKRALLIEVKNMGIGLFVVFAIWGLLHALIWLSVVLLGLAGQTF